MDHEVQYRVVDSHKRAKFLTLPFHLPGGYDHQCKVWDVDQGEVVLEFIKNSFIAQILLCSDNKVNFSQ